MNDSDKNDFIHQIDQYKNKQTPNLKGRVPFRKEEKRIAVKKP